MIYSLLSRGSSKAGLVQGATRVTDPGMGCRPAFALHGGFAGRRTGSGLLRLGLFPEIGDWPIIRFSRQELHKSVLSVRLDDLILMTYLPYILSRES